MDAPKPVGQRDSALSTDLHGSSVNRYLTSEVYFMIILIAEAKVANRLEKLSDRLAATTPPPKPHPLTEATLRIFIHLELVNLKMHTRKIGAEPGLYRNYTYK